MKLMPSHQKLLVGVQKCDDANDDVAHGDLNLCVDHASQATQKAGHQPLLTSRKLTGHHTLPNIVDSSYIVML